MKLRNKKTGEIHEITEVVPLHDMDKKFVIYSQTEGHNYAYKNLTELIEEWEDASEEPKDYWYIEEDGDVIDTTYLEDDKFDQKRRQIGNYFSTREEAEKAVEKLKAIKILKDYDLHIEWANTPEYNEDYDEWCCSVDFSVREGCNGDKLFDLLFGGEE